MIDETAGPDQAEQELREMQARTAFLAEASNVLASSLDYETTLASVARLAVPKIADWCAVDIVQEDGSVRSVAVAHVDPAKVQLARDLQERVPFDPDAPIGVPRVLRTSEPEVIGEIPDELLVEATPDEELLQILRDLGLKSSMVVPLVARGHTLGAISMVAAESGRRFNDADLDLAMDLAGRAALAVDNARLYRESQELAAHQQAILQQMADGVAITDQHGRVTFVNQAARAISSGMARATLDEYVGSPDILTLSGAPFTADDLPLARALRGETVTDAYWVLRRGGVETVVQGNAAPVRLPDGTLLGVVTTFRDVTAQVTLERQKNTFLSAAAHDLKTPLTSVKALAQMLLRRVQRGDEVSGDAVKTGLSRIDAAVDRMTRLINELLDATRIQMGTTLELNRSEHDLVALIREAVEDCQESTEQHEVIMQAPREIVGVWDADRIQRVFGNLLGNAIRYSPGGRVRVTIRETAQDRERWAEITVADEGQGIPAADLPRIFDRFYRAANVRDRIAGTGIGLTSAKHIVEQHGGSIDVESVEGRGTTFTVRLPIVSVVEGTSNG